MSLTVYSQQHIANQTALNREMLDRWILFIDAKPRTVETYAKAMKQFYQFLADKGIQQPKREDVIAYRDMLKDEGKTSSTIQVYITAVRLFFRWLSVEGIYPSIAEHIKGAKVSTAHKKDYLTSNQAKTLVNAISTSTIQGKRDHALLTLMITTGVRTIEVERANVGDMRTAGDNTVLYIQGKGKDDKSEYVKIDQRVEAIMRDYLAEAGITDPSAPLFQSMSNNSKGKALTTRAIRGIIGKYLEITNLKSDRLTAHSLRHTAVTLSLLGGLTLQEAQQYARHANITTTQIYAHNLEMATNKGSETVANALF